MILEPDHVSIKRVELAWWGYEVIGIAPLLRFLTTNEMIEIDDYTNYGMSARFKAASMVSHSFRHVIMAVAIWSW